MRYVVGWSLVAALVVGAIVGGFEWYRRYERELDRRCAAVERGARRVDIGVGQKLCFTEDWRWVKI